MKHRSGEKKLSKLSKSQCFFTTFHLFSAKVSANVSLLLTECGCSRKLQLGSHLLERFGLEAVLVVRYKLNYSCRGEGTHSSSFVHLSVSKTIENTNSSFPFPKSVKWSKGKTLWNRVIVFNSVKCNQPQVIGNNPVTRFNATLRQN